MSAFFLARKDREELVQKAFDTFSYRGFKNGRKFSTSAGTLILYPKQNKDNHNYLETDHGSIYCIGTIVYRGQTYHGSLEMLLKDFVDGSVDSAQLHGAFVVIIDHNAELTFLMDETRMYRLFTNEQHDYISSSLIVASQMHPITLDSDAVMEQLLCGYVGGGKTLISNVVDISFDMQSLAWVKTLDVVSKRSIHSSDDYNATIRYQAEMLSNYMSDVKAIVEENGCECGLSGGCDSRLIFTSVNETGMHMNTVHTHQTSAIHDKEIEVVKKVASLYDTPLRIIPTTYLPECTGDIIDNTLKENVLYFDARNAGNIGAMSLTHTRDYKKQTSEGAGLTFSGIGGEILRDFYYTKLPFFSINGWLETRIFESGIVRLLPSQDYKRVRRKIKNNILVRSKLHFGVFATPVLAKRYFDSYRIPYALSNVVCANNTLSYYLAPFTEAPLIEAAKTGNQYQDHSGVYEGQIISLFNPKASELLTSRGFPLSAIPQRVQNHWKRLSLYPSFVWQWRGEVKGKDSKRSIAHNRLIEKSDYYNNALRFFKAKFPALQYDVIDKGLMDINNFVFTVCSIYEICNIQK